MNNQTTKTTKLSKETNMNNQPAPLTNTVTRNPKLKTFTIIQNYDNKITTKEYNYITKQYKTKYNLKVNPIKVHMLKKYNQLVNDYNQDYFNKYGRYPKYLRETTKYRLRKQAHESVTNWNIHKNYSNKYLVIIQTSDHLQQSGTQQKHTSNSNNNYSALSLKQLLRHKGLKLQLRDKETGITIKHTTTGLHTWDEINEQFNTLISELQEAIIISTNNLSTPLNQTQQEKYEAYYQDYKEVPHTQYYSQQHYYNGNYINTYDKYQTVVTKQDVETANYLLANDLLEYKVPTQESIDRLHNIISTLERLRNKLYSNYQTIDTAIKTQLDIEYYQSKLDQLTIQQETALSYEAISFKI